MFGTMIPETFANVLATYATCFQARSYPTFQWLVLGWVQCLERRTLTAVALASGAVGARHISVFHRFFARAEWSLDAVGQVVFEQALRWLPGPPQHCAGAASGPGGRRGMKSGTPTTGTGEANARAARGGYRWTVRICPGRL